MRSGLATGDYPWMDATATVIASSTARVRAAAVLCVESRALIVESRRLIARSRKLIRDRDARTGRLDLVKRIGPALPSRTPSMSVR